MYKLISYYLPKTGRWRWKFQYNSRVLARSEHSYINITVCEQAFKKLAAAAQLGNYSTLYED